MQGMNFDFWWKKIHTGKSFSEARILESTNPRYDKRLFIKLQVQYMKIASSEHILGYVVDTKLRNSDIDLPAIEHN